VQCVLADSDTNNLVGNGAKDNHSYC